MNNNVRSVDIRKLFILPAVNVIIALAIILSNKLIYGNSSIIANYMAITFLFADILMLVIYLNARKKNNYSLYAGVSGKEDKSILERNFYESTINSSLASMLTLISTFVLLMKNSKEGFYIFIILLYVVVIAYGSIKISQKYKTK